MWQSVHELHDDVVVGALRELRETRRRRRLGDWNIIDALYKAYLAAILGTVVVGVGSGLIGDEPLGPAALQDVRDVGPAVLGGAIAIAIALGLRGGARGGPLALEAAEVRYVLLAPVDRDVALRRPALRQLRFSAFAGLVTGAAIGLLAYRRLPGQAVAWIACGALTGAATALAASGAAMIASGRRIGRTVAVVLGAVLVAWSLLDLVIGKLTSPLSYLGDIAVWPLRTYPLAALALSLPLAMAAIGVRSIGGMSLEAAERRGRLVTHLRFAATLQDVRTVMLLRRQLASELPRSRPWVQMKPGGWTPAIWRRDWRGILRWPAVRLARLLVLGVIAGLSVAVAWAGTTPMIAVAGLALFIAGLDAVEGLAQEVDHPDRRDSMPVDPNALHLRHLVAPAIVLTVVALTGVLAAAALGSPELAFQVGMPLVVPVGALAAGGAAVSTLRAPPDMARMMMDSTGLSLLFHHALPPAIATLGPAAILLVHSQLRTDPSAAPAAVAFTAATNLAIVAVIVFGWVRHRDAVREFFAGGGFSSAGK